MKDNNVGCIIDRKKTDVPEGLVAVCIAHPFEYTVSLEDPQGTSGDTSILQKADQVCLYSLWMIWGEVCYLEDN